MVGNLKSNLLLAASCIAAIAAVGSVFELTSGIPELGNLVTGVILGITGPLSAGLLYLAIREARASM